MEVTRKTIWPPDIGIELGKCVSGIEGEIEDGSGLLECDNCLW